MAQVVEALYASHAYSLAEMARWSKRPKSNPYRATAGPGFLQCGHNPFLTAWYVRKLTVDVDEASGVETIRWEYPAQYRYNDTMSRTELIREPQAGEFRRPAVGPSQLGR